MWVARGDWDTPCRFLIEQLEDTLATHVSRPCCERKVPIWSADRSGAGSFESDWVRRYQGSLHNRSVNSVVSSSGRNPLRKMLGISNHRRTETEGKGRKDRGRMELRGRRAVFLSHICAAGVLKSDSI